MAIDNYLNDITSQHRTKPKYIAWLSAPLTILDDNVTMTNGIPSAFDIDNAVGVQLDVLGQIVGRSRVLNFQPSSGASPTLNDDNYRIALKAKIAQNQWDGSIPGIYEIWDSLFTDISLNIVDNQNMTMSALVDGQVDDVISEMVAAGYIVPKPFGVSLTIIEVTNISGNDYVGALVSESDTITLSVAGP